MCNRVKEWRKKRGMTQRVLAYTADITEAYLSKIERGVYTPTIDVARRLAAALSCTLDDLFGPKGNKPM